MADPRDRLLDQIGYRFRDPGLFEVALTHRSAGSRNNERLEFLGDSILSLTISTELFHRFPQAKEGQLSRMRASLVKGETLAKLARELSLGDYLVLGSGELKSGGFRRESILADAMEAIFGAILLDSDVEQVRDIILALYRPLLDKASPERVMKDPKTRLQEHLQSRHHPLPDYRVLSVTGADHNQHFVVRCAVPALDQSVDGEGGSRRKAEQAAADAMLTILEEL